MNNEQQVKEILEKIWYVTIATVSKDGRPWNTPVYSAYNEQYNFYWASWKENEHSKNIQNNSSVFLVVYDSTAPEGSGRGVYIEAIATEVVDEHEIEHAMKYYYGRKNREPRKPEEFLGDNPRRIYKATPKRFWLNSNGEVDGKFVDTRIEVKLL